MPTKDIQSPELESEDILASLDLMEEELELTSDERAELEQEAEDMKSRFKIALEKLGNDLAGKFKQYCSRRNSKELEWVSAMLQHEGPEKLADLKDVVNQQVIEQSEKINLNITRPRVSTAISKMKDIQFPLGGDFNFHLKSEPLVNLEQNINNTTPVQGPPVPPGTPPEQMPPQQTVGDIASERLREARDKARRMEVKIKEQLNQADYGTKAREAMWDWGVLGTAIIKGPTVKLTPKKSYKHIPDSEGGLQSELNTEFVEVLDVNRVDPRLFWPDPNAMVISDAEDAFEGHFMSKKQLRALANNPSFMSDRIVTVLGTEPDADAEGYSNVLFSLFDADQSLKNRYLVKEYRGCIDKEILFMMGEISLEEKDDPLTEFQGEVWLVRGVVIRVSLNPVEGSYELPYYVTVLEKDPGSMFGHGMPFMMKDQARVVASTWRMLLDNAGLSAGPQIVLNKDGIEPANGIWDIEPMKLWYATEYMEDVRKSFQFVDIPNNQASLSSVIDAALQFADMESSSPMIQSGGNQPQAHVPAMNMAMTLAEGSVHQREMSQNWDDCITEPLINNIIHYNMQYLSDPSIKGEFHVEVGGATERIDNQILAQDIERILSTAMQNPEYAVQIDEAELFRRWVSATRVGPNGLRSAEAVEQLKAEQQAAMQEQPPDPDSIRAEAVMLQEQTRQQQQQLDAQFKDREMQLKEAQANAEIQAKQMEIQIRQMEMDARLQEATMKMQTAAMELASKEDLTLAQVMKDLEVADMQNETRREMKAAEMEKFRETAELKEEYGTGIST